MHELHRATNTVKYISSALSMALIFLVMGRFLEPVWGSVEFVRFIIFANLLTGVVIFFTQVCLLVCLFFGPSVCLCLRVYTNPLVHRLSITCARSTTGI